MSTAVVRQQHEEARAALYAAEAAYEAARQQLLRARATFTRVSHDLVDDRSLRGLSPREKNVLDLLNQGLANKEIAGNLKLSERTIKFHVSNILEKRRCNSRAQLIALKGLEK